MLVESKILEEKAKRKSALIASASTGKKPVSNIESLKSRAEVDDLLFMSLNKKIIHLQRNLES
tara:strand:+ start:1174 stop:1362 length:189 start_codon:yes stop_codon:yes gene_type:complete